MKYKLLLIAIIFSVSCSAQSFFKPLPKAHEYATRLSLTVVDSSNLTMNAFRPVANIASYGFSNGSGSLLTGAGVSYQHLKWSAADQRWNSVWSLNALAWYNAPLSTTSDPSTTAFAYGIAVGLLNNLILVGGAYNGHSLFPTLGIGISLNN